MCGLRERHSWSTICFGAILRKLLATGCDGRRSAVGVLQPRVMFISDVDRELRRAPAPTGKQSSNVQFPTLPIDARRSVFRDCQARMCGVWRVLCGCTYAPRAFYDEPPSSAPLCSPFRGNKRLERREWHTRKSMQPVTPPPVCPRCRLPQ